MTVLMVRLREAGILLIPSRRGLQGTGPLTERIPWTQRKNDVTFLSTFNVGELGTSGAGSFWKVLGSVLVLPRPCLAPAAQPSMLSLNSEEGMSVLQDGCIG